MKYTQYVPLLTKNYWQVSRIKKDGHYDWNHYVDFKMKERAKAYIMANIIKIVRKSHTMYKYEYEDSEGAIWHMDYHH